MQIIVVTLKGNLALSWKKIPRKGLDGLVVCDVNWSGSSKLTREVINGI